MCALFIQHSTDRPRQTIFGHLHAIHILMVRGNSRCHGLLATREHFTCSPFDNISHVGPAVSCAFVVVSFMDYWCFRDSQIQFTVDMTDSETHLRK